VKRILLFSLLVGMMTASTGCGLFQSIFCYRPCGGHGSRGGCDPCSCSEGCDDGCGPVSGPSCRPVRTGYVPARRAVVADCDDDCDVPCGKPCRTANCRTCDPCADPCGSGSCGRVWHRGPLSCLFALMSPNNWCGPSCGQRYWGDFYSDPPACHDPCDCYGNYNSSGCRSCGCGGSARHTRNVVGQYDDGMSETEESDLQPQAVPTQKSVGTPHKAPVKTPPQ
jgi:hypothetical protein